MGKHRRLTAFARRTWNFRPLIALGAILLMASAAIVYAAANELYHTGNGSVAEAGEPTGPNSTVIIATPGTGPAITPSQPAPNTSAPAPGGTTSVPTQPPPATTAPPPIPPVTSTASPASGAVTGEYTVGDSWGSGFIANVQLTNTRTTAEGWVVSLVYPDGVTGVVNSWIGLGGDTATLSWTGHSLTATSNNPLAAGKTIILGIQFSKTGSDITPTTCQVNQRICSF